MSESPDSVVNATPKKGLAWEVCSAWFPLVGSTPWCCRSLGQSKKTSPDADLFGAFIPPIGMAGGPTATPAPVTPRHGRHPSDSSSSTKGGARRLLFVEGRALTREGLLRETGSRGPATLAPDSASVAPAANAAMPSSSAGAAAPTGAAASAASGVAPASVVTGNPWKEKPTSVQSVATQDGVANTVSAACSGEAAKQQAGVPIGAAMTAAPSLTAVPSAPAKGAATGDEEEEEILEEDLAGDTDDESKVADEGGEDGDETEEVEEVEDEDEEDEGEEEEEEEEEECGKSNRGDGDGEEEEEEEEMEVAEVTEVVEVAQVVSATNASVPTAKCVPAVAECTPASAVPAAPPPAATAAPEAGHSATPPSKAPTSTEVPVAIAAATVPVPVEQPAVAPSQPPLTDGKGGTVPSEGAPGTTPETEWRLPPGGTSMNRDDVPLLSAGYVDLHLHPITGGPSRSARLGCAPSGFAFM